MVPAMREGEQRTAPAGEELTGAAAREGLRAASARSVPRDERPLPGARSDRVPWLIALAVFAAYTTISVYRFWRLQPTSWDLGVFTECVKQYAQLASPVVDVLGPGVNMLGQHFSPVLALIAPFFLLFPSPVTLLVVQAALAAVSVIPVSRAASLRLGRAAARTIGAAYGLSWGLQQLVNYDFHEVAFAVPLLAFSLSALVSGRRRAAAAWALPLVFVKEDLGFTVAAIGIVMVMLTWRERKAAGRGHLDLPGLLLIVWGLGWSLLAIELILPHFNAAHRYPYWSMGGVLRPAGDHLALTGLAAQLSAGLSVKLPTIALILLVSAFIAVRSPIAVVAVPGLALRQISTNIAYWGTDWHYNATVMPIMFIAAVDGLARIRAAAARGQARPLAVTMGRHGAAAMLAICLALAYQFPLNQLWSPQTYAVGRHATAAEAAMSKVPDGATVATDLDLLAPLAARTDTFWLGNRGPAPQYVVFDTQSTDWQPPPPNVLAFVEHRYRGAAYRRLFSSDGVAVMRRVGR